MSPVLTAILILGAVGAVAAIVLVLAAKYMAVKEDERFPKVRECLPGANCGACGYPGCDGYAAALAESGVKTNLCIPGADTVAQQISSILGVAFENVVEKIAVVHCGGDCDATRDRTDYEGPKTCAAAKLFGGKGSCSYGCIGFGDCVEVCPYDAIHICEGVARINPLACHACKMCVNTCPKGIIDLMPLHEAKAAVMCKNHDKGAQTRKECKAGCIGCMKCVKTCEYGAVTVENFCAKVDYDKCVGCGKCHEACPVKCIDVIEPGVKITETKVN